MSNGCRGRSHLKQSNSFERQVVEKNKRSPDCTLSQLRFQKSSVVRHLWPRRIWKNTWKWWENEETNMHISSGRYAKNGLFKWRHDSPGIGLWIRSRITTPEFGSILCRTCARSTPNIRARILALIYVSLNCTCTIYVVSFIRQRACGD